MGGHHSQKLRPRRGIRLLSGAQTSDAQRNQHCNKKLRRDFVGRRFPRPAGAWLSYRLPGSFLESRGGSLLPRAEGLLEGYRSGRPPLLTAEQRTQLCDILDSGPVAYGLDTGLWTSPMLAWVIEEEFGVAYHPGHVRKLLHGLGFSVQRPHRVLARADASEQDRWHRRTYPNLKKPRPQNSWVSCDSAGRLEALFCDS